MIVNLFWSLVGWWEPCTSFGYSDDFVVYALSGMEFEISTTILLLYTSEDNGLKMATTYFGITKKNVVLKAFGKMVCH